jgi:hypothetical protein
MATQNYDITKIWVPDNADVWWEPASVRFSTAPWKDPILVFKETAARRGAFGAFYVPGDYVGTPVIVVRWTTDTATTGDAEWDFDYRAVAVGESVNQAGTQESVNQEDTAPGTAGLLQEMTKALSANFATGDRVSAGLFRDGSDAGDGLAGADEACVFEVLFRYSDA